VPPTASNKSRHDSRMDGMAAMVLLVPMGRGHISQSATWSRVQLLLHPLYPPSSILNLLQHHGLVAASVFITKLPALAGTAIDNLLLFYVDSWGIYMVMP